MSKYDILTADGEQFETDRTYYWYDRAHNWVECANWIDCQVRKDEGVVYVCGTKIAIRILRNTKEAALQDGLAYYDGQILALEECKRKLCVDTVNREDSFNPEPPPLAEATEQDETLHMKEIEDVGYSEQRDPGIFV